MDYDITGVKKQKTMDKTRFPYEIGTRVSVKSPYSKKLATIVGLSYNSSACMQYEIKFDGEDVVVHYPTELMTPVPAEQPKELLIGMIKDKNGDGELNTHKDYEIKEVDGKFKLIKKQPKYPKTYEECCKVLGITPALELKKQIIVSWNIRLLSYLQQLLICRNAYWEIAKEELGLDKLWEPKYEQGVDNEYYTIHTFNNNLYLAGTSHRNAILAFPTEEMRDAFYENFKELIEQCKELL